MLRGLDEEGAFLQPLLASETAKARLSPEDRRLAWELVLGVSRRWGTLSAQLDELLKEPFEKLPEDVKRALVLGAYQSVYLEKIPPHAIVNESVELAKRVHASFGGLTNRVLKRLIQEGPPALDSKKGLDLLSAQMSHPKWWVQMQLSMHTKAEVLALAEAHNLPAPLTICVHPDREPYRVLEQIKAEGGTVTDARWVEGSFALEHPQPFSAPSFRLGGWYAQDEASQLVVRFLDPKPGMRIWDVCAAPGGKSIALAGAVRSEGSILATELHPRKASALSERLERYPWVKVREHDALQPLDDQDSTEPFDAILIDAPCSALGVIRRHPEIRWRRTKLDVKRAATKQLKLLEAVAMQVKVGGVVLYSVCTDSPEETTGVIQSFLMAYPEFELGAPPTSAQKWDVLCDRGALSLNPATHGTDGFFAARLNRMR